MKNNIKVKLAVGAEFGALIIIFILSLTSISAHSSTLDNPPLEEKTLKSSLELVISDIWTTAEKSIDMAKEGFAWLIENPKKGKFFVKCDSGKDATDGTRLGIIKDAKTNRDYYLAREECEMFTSFLSGMKDSGFKDVQVKIELSQAKDEEISLKNATQRHFSANVKSIDMYEELYQPKKESKDLKEFRDISNKK
jgi:hypothetical protein